MMTRAGYILDDATMNYSTIATKFFGKLSEKDVEKYKKRLEKLEGDMKSALPELYFATGKDWHQALTPEEPLGKALQSAKKIIAGLQNPETRELFCDEDVYRPIIDKVSSAGYRLASNLERNIDVQTRRRIHRFVGEPIYSRPGHYNISEDESIEELYIADVGREAITKIIKKVADASPKKTRNVMIDNVEYNTQTVRDIKEAVGDAVDIYATYKDGDNNLVTKDLRRLIENTAIGNHLVVKKNCMDVVLQKFTFEQEFQTSTPRGLFTDEADKLYSRVRKGGIALVEVPDFIMRSKECLDIARRFELAFAYRIPVKAEWFNAQYVMLALKPREYVFSDVGSAEDLAVREKTYQRLMSLELVDEITDELMGALLQDMPKGEYGRVELFQGEQIDKALVEVILEESTLSLNSMKKKVHVLEPVMPPSKGQLGQIMASGRLDGIIDEGNGHKHVIRGRVHKGYESTLDYEEMTNGEVKRVEKKLCSNVIEVNYFGGDGSYKTLATSAKRQEEQ